MKRVSHPILSALTKSCLAGSGCPQRTANDVDKALGHASLCGIDSHGYRLLPHYCRAIEGGRIDAKAITEVNQLMPSIVEVDANNGLGHHAMYAAVDALRGPVLRNGLGCALVINSSHFGPAGAYALYGAENGFLALVTCNSDAFVPLFSGQTAFHGTNPIAFAAPTSGPNPYLFDMATSAVPINRVLSAREKKEQLPPDVALDAAGESTRNSFDALTVAPLGADYGFKGAGLAGIAEVLSAILTGMGTSDQLLPMTDCEDWSTPRGLGQFLLMLRPDCRLSDNLFGNELNSYLKRLRNSPAKANGQVMAPGDREWATKKERLENGIPVPDTLVESFYDLANKFNLKTGF